MGHVWPNLAFPKSYGYILAENSELMRLVQTGSSWDDRLSRRLHRKRGANRVRRRILPTLLYTGLRTTGGCLLRYDFLVREARRNIAAEPVSAASLGLVTRCIMDAEFSGFHNHFTWHALNRQISRAALVLTRNADLRRWRVGCTDAKRSRMYHYPLSARSAASGTHAPHDRLGRRRRTAKVKGAPRHVSGSCGRS